MAAELQNGELLREVYDKVNEIHRDMSVLREQVAGENGVIKIAKDHERRIRDTEKFVWKVLGVATVIAIAVPLIIKLLA